MFTLSPSLLRFPDALLAREWLVTNGLGGYASGTVAGACTRRYHGLLVAALAPPVRRAVLVAKVDEEVEIDDRLFELGTNEYHDGTIAPTGYAYLSEFRLAGTVPSWTFSVPGADVEKTIWMGREQNSAYVRYRLLPGSRPARLRIRPYLTERDHHGTTRGNPGWKFGILPMTSGIRVEPWPGAIPYALTVNRGTFMADGAWYWKVLHREERARGLDDLEDLYVPGEFEVALAPGDAVTLLATTDLTARAPSDDEDVYESERKRQSLLSDSALRLADDDIPIPEEGGLPRRLVLAADQFLVRGPARRTIIAGYHWFTDWGRDAMIALPGLTLVTGRVEEARDILLSFAGTVDEGMLPNRFPDQDGTPEYTSADAALWLFSALHDYLNRTKDRALLTRVFPALEEIVDRYRRGTRHGIRVDPADGLLEAGAPGFALTWMDARIDGRVITPRQGKAVELNALWYNALRLIAGWAETQGRDPSGYDAEARRMRASFTARFTHAAAGYLYDVIGPDGTPDAALRPNQIFALSLPHPVIEGELARSILDIVTEHLLTPVGLRSLAPGSPEYRGSCTGGPARRDEAYHQGTVWPWLLGPYVKALVRVTGDRLRARRLLEPFRGHLLEAGLGTVGEIFDGDPPHRPRGCIAQAWSVAALLEAWELVGGESR
jgi:predicted glycogen debranching enzyme